MACAGALQHSPDIRKRELRRTTQLIVPAQLRFCDDDAPLTENPVGQSATVRLVVQFDATDDQRPAAGTANIKVGSSDFQRVQPQLTHRHRPPRHGERHKRQGKRRSPLAVIEPDIGQVQVGMQAVPAGIDPTDGHLAAKAARQSAFDQGPIILGIRQNRVTQENESQRYHEKNQPGQPFGQPESARERTAPSGDA